MKALLKKGTLALAGLLLCESLFAAPRENLNELRARIEALQKELEQKEESKNEAADALRESERSISKAERKLRETTDQQTEVNSSLEQLQNQTLVLEKDINSQQELLSTLLYQRYVEGEDEYLKLLLGARDPNQVARDLEYYGYLSRDRAEVVRKLKTNRQSLGQLIAQKEQKSRILADLAASEMEQKQALEKEKGKRKGILNKVSIQISEQRKEISKLKRDESRLARLVERLGKIIRHSAPSQLDNSKLPDASLDRNPFAALKGRMSLPVKGVVANRFGATRESGVQWKGLFIRSAAGQEVRAVARGRVVFADWLRGFGNIIIVDHGNGYMSLYGYNESLLKQVGDMVHGGDAIASVGNSGGNGESGLYFELREQGRPLDPLQWVSVK